MLNWTHQHCRVANCPGTTDCEFFPTLGDRVDMARAAYREYAEADGTSLTDFVVDVLLLAMSELNRPAADLIVLDRERLNLETLIQRYLRGANEDAFPKTKG